MFTSLKATSATTNFINVITLTTATNEINSVTSIRSRKCTTTRTEPFYCNVLLKFFLKIDFNVLILDFQTCYQNKLINKTSAILSLLTDF
jgi:hypothetical protein